MRITGNPDIKMINFINELHKSLISKMSVVYPDIESRLNACDYEVKLCNRLQIAAGNAKGRRARQPSDKHWNKLQVSLNYRLLANNVQELEKTYAHELAHIICYVLYPTEKVKHGAKWAAIMANLGYEPEVTHNLDVNHLRRAVRRYEYACSNYQCGKRFKLTAYKHNRSFKYRCNLCKSAIGCIGED